MTIDTLVEWNARIAAGSCQFPGCGFLQGPVISLETETANPCGYGMDYRLFPSMSDADSRVIYKTRTTTYDHVESKSWTVGNPPIPCSSSSNAHSRVVCVIERDEYFHCYERRTKSSQWGGSAFTDAHSTGGGSYSAKLVNGVCTGTRNFWQTYFDKNGTTDYNVTEAWNQCPGCWAITGTFSSPATITSANGETVQVFSDPVAPSDLVFPDDCTGRGTVSTHVARMPQRGGGWNVIRYRFHVPAGYNDLYRSMTYCKITWDVLFEPLGDPDNSEFLEEGLTVEWTGPGNKDAPSGDTWMTPWNILLPPTEAGEHRIVNIRYEFFRSKYGTRPMVVGEAWEPPTP